MDTCFEIRCGGCGRLVKIQVSICDEAPPPIVRRKGGRPKLAPTREEFIAYGRSRGIGESISYLIFKAMAREGWLRTGGSGQTYVRQWKKTFLRRVMAYGYPQD